jgi:hypothetical protein
MRADLAAHAPGLRLAPQSIGNTRIEVADGAGGGSEFKVENRSKV